MRLRDDLVLRETSSPHFAPEHAELVALAELIARLFFEHHLPRLR